MAITGLGLVTPVGNDVADDVERAAGGPQRRSRRSRVRCERIPGAHRRRGESFDLDRAIADRKLLKFANRSHRFALAAAEQAMRDAGIRPTRDDAARWGCVVGTGMMGVAFDELADVQRHAAPGGELDTIAVSTRARRRSDGVLPQPGDRGRCAAAAPLRHPRLCDVGAHRVRLRRTGARNRDELIRRGAADRVLAGGFDSMINPVGLGGFCLLTAVSPDNDTPERASRPFDATRNGFVLGEGAGFLVLEEWDGAPRAERTSMPSSQATATRCRATASPTRIRPATGRSRRCARRSAMPARGRTMSTT